MSKEQTCFIFYFLFFQMPPSKMSPSRMIWKIQSVMGGKNQMITCLLHSDGWHRPAPEKKDGT